MKYFPLILFSVLLNACAQIFMKRGMSEFHSLGFTWKELEPALPRMVTSIPLLLAIACYGISVIVWMGVLSKVEISLAYPMLSIGYLVVLAYGYYWGNEQIGIDRVIGIVLICAGIVFLFRSA